ncbi:hypothetical protein [Trinickia symbiotica]|uniref:hypothetical protein n=1 Tax=Trinickia symbiotica TaxID=863227 RepID=UPI0011AED4CD|nr:hypothetical protein [Trinickia symbiotica]
MSAWWKRRNKFEKDALVGEHIIARDFDRVDFERARAPLALHPPLARDDLAIVIGDIEAGLEVAAAIGSADADATHAPLNIPGANTVKQPKQAFLERMPLQFVVSAKSAPHR